MKNTLLKIKRDFILKNAPQAVTHWNEDKDKITFFEINAEAVEVKKPLWLKLIELIIYSKVTGNYKDNPILTSIVYIVFGLILGMVMGWMV